MSYVRRPSRRASVPSGAAPNRVLAASPSRSARQPCVKAHLVGGAKVSGRDSSWPWWARARARTTAPRSS